MFRSKKGLSPLIAAVLLIVVVVGIGAIVMNIVRGQVTSNKQIIERTSTDIECSTLMQITVPVYDDDFLMCIDSTNNVTNFTLENIGSIDVDNLQVKVFGDTGFDDIDDVLPSGLAPGQVNNTISVGYAGSVGTVEEIFIIPKKSVSGMSNKIYCTEAQLKFVDIASC
jgi:FlaG/FlaF family flagellin (archaellin)